MKVRVMSRGVLRRMLLGVMERVTMMERVTVRIAGKSEVLKKRVEQFLSVTHVHMVMHKGVLERRLGIEHIIPKKQQNTQN